MKNPANVLSKPKPPKRHPRHKDHHYKMYTCKMRVTSREGCSLQELAGTPFRTLQRHSYNTPLNKWKGIPFVETKVLIFFKGAMRWKWTDFNKTFFEKIWQFPQTSIKQKKHIYSLSHALDCCRTCGLVPQIGKETWSASSIAMVASSKSSISFFASMDCKYCRRTPSTGSCKYCLHCCDYVLL